MDLPRSYADWNARLPSFGTWCEKIGGVLYTIYDGQPGPLTELNVYLSSECIWDVHGLYYHLYGLPGLINRWVELLEPPEEEEEETVFVGKSNVLRIVELPDDYEDDWDNGDGGVKL